MADTIPEISKDDLIYFGYRVEPYFASHIIISGMLDMVALKKIFDWNTGVRWLQVNYTFYEFKNDLTALEKELHENIKQKGISYINSVVSKCSEYGNILLEISKRKGSEAAQATSKALLANEMEDFFVAMKAYTVFYCLALFERPMMDIAQDLAKRNSTTEEELALFELITTPIRETAVEYEQENLLRIAASPEHKREALAELHAKKYGWLAIRFFVGDPWATKDVLARVEDINTATASAELERRIALRKKQEENIEYATQAFSKQDKDLVRVVREIVYLRNQRADYYNESAHHTRPLLNKIALELGVTYPDLLHINAKEIIRALNNEFDYKKHIENRKRNFLIYHNGDNSIILEDKEVGDFIKKNLFLDIKSESAGEITGKIGYRGKVKGTVRIVKFNEDIAKVGKGDILVSPMTIPNFMPAMERAAAFITDEGGITCHAAIIAREMQKPCIIGTKIATQVLKDGDMVEVDAEKGLVRILS